MIKSISVNSVNSSNNRQNQPQFKGGIGEAALAAATSAIQICEQNPMVNVAVLDLATAIVPRTIVESETNPHAGFEAFRRESSGLIINCMIPGLIVAGIAKAISGTMMGQKTGMSGCWANEDTINLVTKYWKEAPDDAVIGKEGKELFAKGEKAKAYRTIENILKETKGADGKNMVDFKNFDFEKSITTYTKNVFETVPKKDLGDAYKNIVDQTKAAEHIKIKGHVDKKTGKIIDEYFTQSLGDVLGNATKIIKETASNKFSSLEDFTARSNKLVTAKSLGGLAVIIPLALAAQPVNRWITEKTSGKKGAPIYKDFGQTQTKELTSKEKAGLFTQKIISVSAMVGVAMLSIMKKPDMKMLKNITQFKGIFPSMDQARIISTATFASRMMASEDKNDLREATVRDIATFSAFYFLGDYVAKGIASVIQKFTKTSLINDLAPLKGDENILKKIGHWTKNTALKSSDEITSVRGKQMRALCQIGNIAFSLVALGILIPKINRNKTNKKREEELKKMGVDQQTIHKFYPHLIKNDPTFASKKNTYKAFFTSQ